jgi:hypothetical protein
MIEDLDGEANLNLQEARNIEESKVRAEKW